jgi:hypothetical protein
MNSSTMIRKRLMFFALVGLILSISRLFGAGQSEDPTGVSNVAPYGPPTQAGLAALAFGNTAYAIIPLEEPPDNGLTHEYYVSCVTDSGEVDFTHYFTIDPEGYSSWEVERLLWRQGEIDAAAFYPIEGREYRAMNRAGQYTYWERLPDPVGGGLPGAPDGVIASLKGVFVASDGSESDIAFLKYHDIIDSQALEWEQILLTEWGWSSVAISPQTDAIVNSCHTFFVQEDGTAFGSPAESREYSRTRIRLSNGTSVDDRVRNYEVTAWHHWNIGGTAPSLFDGAPTSKEFDYLHQYAGIFGSGGMGNDAFCFVLATPSGQGGTSTNKWTLRDKTGTILVDLGQEGFNVQGGAPVPGFSRNGHVAQRKSGGCILYRHPSAEKEVLPSAFGIGAGGRDVEVNDVGDLLLKNAESTANVRADMLVRKFTDPVTHEIAWGVRQFSDDTLPTGWSGLQIQALANAQPLAKQRELEGLTPSEYPPKPEDTPLPLLGGTAIKDGKKCPVLLLPVEVTVRKKGETISTNGVLIKKGEVIEVALAENWFDQQKQFESIISWEYRQRNSDGNFGAWGGFGPNCKGSKFENTMTTSGIFQIRALITNGGEHYYKRKKDEKIGSLTYGPGKKDDPDCIGVCDTQIQIDICRETQKFYASEDYTASRELPAQYGFPVYPASGNSVIRCNIFVAHRATAAGATVPKINGFFYEYPPLANEWAGIEDTNSLPGVPTWISHWHLSYVEKPQPGWIIAHPQPGDAGHCAITDYDGEGIGSGISGTVNKNYDEFWDGTTGQRQYYE